MRRRTIGDEGATAFGARRLPLGRRTDDLGMQAKSDERAYFVAVSAANHCSSCLPSKLIWRRLRPANGDIACGL